MNAPFLRRGLLVDGVISGATGLLLLFGAGFLQELLGVPGTLLRTAGVILVPFAAALLYMATRQRLSPGAVRTVIVSNVLWVVASIGLLISGAITPSILGYGFIVMQAVAVGVFAEVQYVGLRRTRSTAV
jgi:hypothetical protein